MLIVSLLAATLAGLGPASPVFPPWPDDASTQAAAHPEYAEYEDLVFYFSTPHEDSGQSWNQDVMAQISRYADLMKRFPDSPLVPTIKLRIAELFSLLTSPTVDDYLNERRQDFLRAHPNATAAELAANDLALQAEIPMEMINEDFRETLKQRLDDIIEHHADADHYSLIDAGSYFEGGSANFAYNGEKAAALALYYRGLFFKENRAADWGRVKKEYPDSPKANYLIDLQRAGKKK